MNTEPEPKPKPEPKGERSHVTDGRAVTFRWPAWWRLVSLAAKEDPAMHGTLLGLMHSLADGFDIATLRRLALDLQDPHTTFPRYVVDGYLLVACPPALRHRGPWWVRSARLVDLLGVLVDLPGSVVAELSAALWPIASAQAAEARKVGEEGASHV